MATINSKVNWVNDATQTVKWVDIRPNDLCNPLQIPRVSGVICSVQVSGSLLGAAIALEVSNDGVNYHRVKDTFGEEIEILEPGIFDFTASALFVRPTITGGLNSIVSVTMVLRG